MLPRPSASTATRSRAARIATPRSTAWASRSSPSPSRRRARSSRRRPPRIARASSRTRRPGDQKRLDAQQEQEECRTCLGPGFPTQVLPEYDGNDCYFRTRKCPLRREDHGSWLSARHGLRPGHGARRRELPHHDRRRARDGRAVCARLADARYIETAFGFTCCLFPPCDIEICIDYVHEASSWERGELVMPTLADWRYCDIHSEKVRGMACIYDHSLPPVGESARLRLLRRRERGTRTRQARVARRLAMGDRARRRV